jgi:transposase
MAKTFRPYVPEQDYLLPPSLREWLPGDHLAYFVSDLVDQLDVAEITAPYEREERGFPPYHPVMLTKVLLYAYCVGVFSSRKIQRRLAEDVAFRVLAAGNEPDFRTIADFRRRHLAALEGLFVQVLRLAREAGALSVGRVAIDGTKIRANASKHKAMSYGRMVEKERQLAQEVHHWLTQAEATDAQEDNEQGRDRRGDELPEDLRRRETRLARIREAKRVLDARAKAEAPAAPADAEAKPVTPKDTAQYNFTDPESRIMKGPDGFVQAYNAQIAVESICQLVVGHAVTQEVNDKRQLAPMIETVTAEAGTRPDEVLADNGYCSEANLEYVRDRGIDAYIATDRLKHDAPLPSLRGRIPKGATLTDRMRRKLRTKVGAAAYRRRKAIVEPVFGHIKHGRGFRQFLLRGVEKVRGEWSLLCLTHNILKCYGLIYG